VRVYYEDTDAGGIVYYANYLKYLERARTEWLRMLGFEQDQLRADFDIVFAVRAVEIQYKKPAHFNEMLEISIDNANLRPASIAIQQSVSRTGRIKNELIVSANVSIVCLHSDQFSPCPIPKPVFRELKACM